MRYCGSLHFLCSGVVVCLEFFRRDWKVALIISADGNVVSAPRSSPRFQICSRALRRHPRKCRPAEKTGGGPAEKDWARFSSWDSRIAMLRERYKKKKSFLMFWASHYLVFFWFIFRLVPETSGDTISYQEEKNTALGNYYRTSSKERVPL